MGAKSGQTVELLLDRVDNVEFGAQSTVVEIVVDVGVLWHD